MLYCLDWIKCSTFYRSKIVVCHNTTSYSLLLGGLLSVIHFQKLVVCQMRSVKLKVSCRQGGTSVSSMEVNG